MYLFICNSNVYYFLVIQPKEHEGWIFLLRSEFRFGSIGPFWQLVSVTALQERCTFMEVLEVKEELFSKKMGDNKGSLIVNNEAIFAFKTVYIHVWANKTRI